MLERGNENMRDKKDSGEKRGRRRQPGKKNSDRQKWTERETDHEGDRQ